MTVDCQPGDHPLDLSNPYPGPRPFPRPEKRDGEAPEKPVFFGRDRERQDLYDLLIAERIVVLYSPSGAGKTSLVQAALIPDMEARGFGVLPVMRCSLKPEREIDPAANRYVLSLLLALEADLEPEERLPLAELVSRAGQERSLHEYLSERKENAKVKAATSRVKGTVLIFDQFEEIFTEDYADQTETAAFFRQVSFALRHPRRWALFVMREEFLGSLESAVRRMPAQFRARFRLEYLDPAAAREAIVQPACWHGVEFQEDAAEELVNNLRQVLAPGASREGERKLGPYIEPVQLQLACEQLWQKRIDALDAGRHLDSPSAITVDDVKGFGDVDQALGTYYAVKVAEASEVTGVRERKIREWTDLNLITGRGFRDQVQHEPDATRGLDNEVLTLLAQAHVLRAERRRDLTWYELSHDRWIWPIQESNRAWRASSLCDFQTEAALWIKRGRPNEYLLRGRDLSLAESWAHEHQTDMEPHETEFLERSQAQQRKLWLRIGLGMVVSAIVLGLVLYILLQASHERGMQDTLTRLKNSSAETAAAAETVQAAAPLTVQAARTAARDAMATGFALTQVARTQTADPHATTSEDVALAGTGVAATRTRAYEEEAAAESGDATAAAEQQGAQALQTSVAQEESTLQPVPEQPTVTDTPTATPIPTATPSDTPTATPSPLPRPTAAPSPRPTTPVPVVCATEPVGIFADTWQVYRNRLGCPLQQEPVAFVVSAEEQFERGFMFWSAYTGRPNGLMLVLSRGAAPRWYQPANWSFDPDGAWCASDFPPPSGLFVPKRGFGGVWCDREDIREALGWATENEYNVDGVVQGFEHGFIFRGSDPKTFYTLFRDDWTYVEKTNP
jgi:hypothetical protein